MKLKDIFNLAVICFGLASCANEAPFSQESKEGEGKFLSHSLAVQVKTDEAVVRAASDGIDVNDFTVAFFNTEKNNGEAEKTYQYNKLPEVVTLPVGTYVVKAYYGGDLTGPAQAAAFSAPYYLGESAQFEIEQNKIIDNLDPVICKLANVKVTINFDKSLVDQMDADSKVSVTVGDSSTLEFAPSTTEAGYFAYVEGSTTLAASFFGTVDGDTIEETKTYDNVRPGTHYRITFKLHLIDPNEPGYVNPGDPGEEIKVDAVVNLEDMTGEGGVDVTPGEELYLEDDRYPKEEPNTPDVPDEPDGKRAPSIVAEAPVDLDKVNIGSELTSCVIKIQSYAEGGIEAFVCDIKSDALSPDELAGVGLASHLDLANTDDDMVDGLTGLGFPVKVAGQSDVKIDITKFLPMLGALDSGQHDFILTVSDANGTTTKTLSIKY